MTLSLDDTPVAAVTVAQYCEIHDVTLRTVKRWLKDDELPGAYQDGRGWWMIPVDAVRTPSLTDVVPMRPAGGSSPQQPGTAVERAIDAAAALPSFLTIDQTAEILGISRHAIVKHREYFGVVPFGVNGALVVPLATIKRIRG